MFKANYKYLIKDRLTEVVSLIQLLSFHNDHYRSVEQLLSDLGNPKSATNWQILLSAHKEFFKVTENGKAYLTTRFYSQQKLEYKAAMDLIYFAGSIHDKELAQRNKNNHRIPIYVSLVATFVSLFSLLYNSNKTTLVIKDTIRNETKLLYDQYIQESKKTTPILSKDSIK